MISIEIRAEYPDGRTASSVYDSLEPDNRGFVDSGIEGNSVVFTIKSGNAGTARNTADDLLACLKTAEGAIGFRRRSVMML